MRTRIDNHPTGGVVKGHVDTWLYNTTRASRGDVVSQARDAARQALGTFLDTGKTGGLLAVSKLADAVRAADPSIKAVAMFDLERAEVFILKFEDAKGTTQIELFESNGKPDAIIELVEY